MMPSIGNNRLLLDSHVFLWALGQPELLSQRVRAELSRADEVWLSAATVWELGIKVALGKLTLATPLRDLLRGAIQQGGVRILEVSAEHALRAAELPLHHRDPFDRLLLAQAQSEKLTLMSRDSRLAAYEVSLLW